MNGLVDKLTAHIFTPFKLFYYIIILGILISFHLNFKRVISNHWTGLWNVITGLDCWTGLLDCWTAELDTDMVEL